MFKKLKHKTYSNRRIVSETKTQRKLIKNCCQATIINLLNNKSKNYRTKKNKIENGN